MKNIILSIIILAVSLFILAQMDIPPADFNSPTTITTEAGIGILQFPGH